MMMRKLNGEVVDCTPTPGAIIAAEMREGYAQRFEDEAKQYGAEAARLIAEGHPPEVVNAALEKLRQPLLENAAANRRIAAELREHEGTELRERCAARGKVAREKREREALEAWERSQV